MIRRPPRSTRLTHSFPTRRSSDLGQIAAEALQHHLGGVLLDAVLVGPLAGLQGALDVDLGALAQILLGHLAELLVEDDDAVPFGALAPLYRVAAAPGFRGGGRTVGGLGSVLGAGDLRHAPHV